MNTKIAKAKCAPVSVKVHPCVSLLPNDYNALENLPKINGVVLSGDLSASDLSLLSSKSEDYGDISVLENGQDNGYVIVLGEEKPSKVSVKELITHGEGFITVDTVNPDIAIGAYQFVEKKTEENN